MAEKNTLNQPFYGWITVISIGLLIGIFGAVMLIIKGHGPTTGTTDQIPWGIFVSSYAFFVAASAGCVEIVSLGYAIGITRLEIIMKRAVFLAIVTLIAGGIIIVLDLGSPLHLFYYIISPNLQAPMWWMSILYIFFLTLLLIQFYFIHTLDVKKLRIINIPVALSAIAVHSTLGAIFGFALVRNYFGGAFAPIYFILIAIAIGTALLLFVTIIQYKVTKTKMSPELHSLVVDLGKFLGVVVSIAIFFALWKDLTGLHSTIETTALAYQHVLSLWSYWVIVILMGLIIPLSLIFAPKKRSLNGILAASTLVLIGMFAARIEFTLGGQIVPVVQNLKHLQSPFGSYSPTFIEIAVVILVFAVSALLYTLGAKKFSLEEVPRHD